MGKFKETLLFTSFLALFHIVLCNQAFAEEKSSISIYENQWDYYSNSQYKAALFESRNASDGTAREQLQLIENPDLHKKLHQSETTQFVSNKKIQDEILDKIPFGDDLKGAWHFVDGDTDIIFIGLRADRRNKGLTFTTEKLPILGEFDDVEFKFSAGEDNEVSFTTHTIPLMGRLEGFSFKATAGDDNNKVFARYTVAFD